jgi:hypothetical protein
MTTLNLCAVPIVLHAHGLYTPQGPQGCCFGAGSGWKRILRWPILLESPGLFGKIAWCRIEKEDYSIVVCWLERDLMRLRKANARPDRWSGVIAVSDLQ